MKTTAIELKNSIIKNIDYLSTEYQMTTMILEDLESMINYNMSSSYIVQWWINNLESIKIINRLIKEIEA